jgi:Fe-S-cluster containining protein
MSGYLAFFQALNQQLRTQPHQGVRLWFAEVPVFVCSACGQCCTMAWKVHVSRAYYESWPEKSGPHYGLSQDEVFELEPRGTAQHYATLRKQPGSEHCVLLDERQRCRPHADFGPEAKPAACRTYPLEHNQLPWKQYAASLLLPSCHKVGRDAPEPQTLQYELQPLLPGMPVPRLALDAQHGFDLAGLLLWIGIQLESLDSASGFSAWMAGSKLQLEALLALPQTELGESELLAQRPQARPDVSESMLQASEAMSADLLRELARGLKQTASLRPLAQGLEQWAKGLELPGALSQAEHELLWNYQRFYWQRQVLAQEWLLGGRLDLLHQQALWAVTGLLIQLCSLWLRQSEPLTAEQIGTATNLVHAYVIQNRQAPQSWSLDKLTPEACLQLLGRMSSWSAI